MLERHNFEPNWEEVSKTLLVAQQVFDQAVGHYNRFHPRERIDDITPERFKSGGASLTYTFARDSKGLQRNIHFITCGLNSESLEVEINAWCDVMEGETYVRYWNNTLFLRVSRDSSEQLKLAMVAALEKLMCWKKEDLHIRVMPH